MSKWLGILLVLSVLGARDNPFVPSKKAQRMDTKFPKDEVFDYFKSIKVSLPTTARVLSKITIFYQDLDGTTHTQEVDINQHIDWHYPLKLTQEGAFLQPEKSTYSIGGYEFWIRENKLYLRTADTLQRSFVLIDPYRLVIDIDRKAKDLRQELSINHKYVRNIAINTHDNFYRFIITLDGQYQYKIDQKDNYLVVNLY
ncbi:AMIN domain-containing protein [Helicobacter bizzozeronii]|uniref:AMIN domain-containing protein n=1 Tax=Helicobacter bizzozeronii TaxID=56877 RepID=UPI000CEEB2F4|nr:AMIN domain-containing protein [Helicobacter bizzozeronii]